MSNACANLMLKAARQINRSVEANKAVIKIDTIDFLPKSPIINDIKFLNSQATKIRA
jgi:hypothetical protein